MIHFLRFTTTNDQVVYLDADSIVMVSELRYRVNDIGYVGSTITFHVGTAASSINVKDDPDAIYHYLKKAELVHDQEMFLSFYKSAVPTDLPQKTRVYKPDGTSYIYPDEQKPQVLSSFLVHLFEELNRFYWDTTKKLLWIPQVDDVIVDKEGSTWLVTESNPPTIKAKAIGLHQDVAMFSLDCIAPYFSEHSFDLGVQALVGRKNKRTTPNPPQETPPCNGNGEDQSTEE